MRSLHPGNVDVVMALGDSITAGFAMRGVFPADVLEWRGDVYSMGGNKGALTVANFIKTYNSHVVGAATGTSLPLTKGKALNAAVSGAKISDVPAQIEYLEHTFKTKYASTSLADSNKLLTLWIGANDICGACKHGNISAQAAAYEAKMEAVLDKVFATFPRTFVSVLTIFNVSDVYVAGQQKAYCREIFKIVQSECGCMEKYGWEGRAAMGEAVVAFNNVTHAVVAKFQAKLDPATSWVVVQPQNERANIPAMGEDYLSDLDCFHPSLFGDKAFAIGLWNNMFLPPDRKVHTLNPTVDGHIYYGIAAHEDGPLYEGKVAIVSLGAPIVMQFFDKVSREQIAAVFLPPRSLLVFAHAAYTDVLHCIDAREHDVISPETVDNYADAAAWCAAHPSAATVLHPPATAPLPASPAYTVPRATRTSITIRRVLKVSKFKLRL
ncbi:uncharacterized protein AMSG_12346 [Thecamonas trahens ATCC 50062]|uniref:Uncharacterized protein n=1 Tax=Thecamonas trahens ATCC 50062 TaxID=461836 RepID=A0A0L0DSB5_THETB|nr:hypothetical protein AMSG_12346 [Thecamonas trahens ATCC 50062]KNC54348.1 hypothetical protein AMSG_12346 [Thecamonas trahens ATCC 50062]|eukprot:XP_013753829.1 hypothetical protein AMSG_12346 [Thecamonas trahens ATCC 50062]